MSQASLGKLLLKWTVVGVGAGGGGGGVCEFCHRG